MGRRNYLIEGLSGTGKTSVAEGLERRGHHVVHGDRTLAYRGDPETGARVEGFGHEHHIWDVDRVRSIAADDTHDATFFCGGSRNFAKFIDVFDRVFVLEVDLETLHRRLDARPAEEWGGGVRWNASASSRGMRRRATCRRESPSTPPCRWSASWMRSYATACDGGGRDRRG